MTYPKKELLIIHESDDDNGNPTLWAVGTDRENNNINGGRQHFVWISLYPGDVYIVENSDGYNLNHKKTFKTLWGAKRSAEEHIFRQEDTGCFTD